MTCGRSMWAAMKSASTTLHSRLRPHPVAQGRRPCRQGIGKTTGCHALVPVAKAKERVDPTALAFAKPRQVRPTRCLRHQRLQLGNGAAREAPIFCSRDVQPTGLSAWVGPSGRRSSCSSWNAREMETKFQRTGACVNPCALRLMNYSLAVKQIVGDHSGHRCCERQRMQTHRCV